MSLHKLSKRQRAEERSALDHAGMQDLAIRRQGDLTNMSRPGVPQEDVRSARGRPLDVLPVPMIHISKMSTEDLQTNTLVLAATVWPLPWPSTNT